MTTTQDEADLLAERCFDQWDINRIRPAVASEFRYLMTKIGNAEASHLETIDERDRLKGEIARLRAALEPFAGISGGLAGSIIGKMARHSISVLNTPDYPEASAEVELTKQIMDAVPKARAALLTEGEKL